MFDIVNAWLFTRLFQTCICETLMWLKELAVSKTAIHSHEAHMKVLKSNVFVKRTRKGRPIFFFIMKVCHSPPPTVSSSLLVVASNSAVKGSPQSPTLSSLSFNQLDLASSSFLNNIRSEARILRLSV